MAFRMMTMALALSTAMLTVPVFAQTHEEHHPGQTAGSSSQSQATPQSMMGGPGHMQSMMGGQGMGMMGPRMGMGGAGGRGMGMGTGGVGMMSPMAGHVEGRIAFLKAELHITDAQQKLWDAVADAMRADAKEMYAMRSQMMGATPANSLPARLEGREKLLQARLDAVRKLKSAVDPLYAALSDAQKKTADQLMYGPGMGMGRGMGGGRMMGMARP